MPDAVWLKSHLAADRVGDEALEVGLVMQISDDFSRRRWACPFDDRLKQNLADPAETFFVLGHATHCLIAVAFHG